ncbi:M14 family metallopeptidase [Heliobacterium mobile]|nr:M14 family metallopeptidase [Heliobacterium mobile]
MLEPILELNIPFREPMVLYKNEFRGSGDGPIISLVAGMHGDEISATYLLTRLAAFLERVVRGMEPHFNLRGTVRLIPIVNVPGINFASRNWPFDGTDINRMFPGYNLGETTQRIADGVFQGTRDSHYAFDVHGSNEQFYEIPHVRVFSQNEKDMELAPYLRCRYVLKRELTPLYKTQLSYHWKESGISTSILMLGVARQIDDVIVNHMYEGLIDYMLATEILEGPPPAPPLEIPTFGRKNTHLVLSQAAGIFRPFVQAGAMLRKGEPMGQILNILTGQLEEEVRAPASGLLASLRMYPLVYEKELLARVFTTMDNPLSTSDVWYQEQ